MPSYRCDRCGISYPPGQSKCRVCDEVMRWSAETMPDPDWQQRAQTALEPHVREGETDRVVAWRTLRFLQLGCGLGDAELLGLAMYGDARVDVHEFARLRAAGCTVELATSILL